MKKALAAVFAIAMVASLVFKINEGFGAGHGDYDRLLGILALPWILIPWPRSFFDHPFFCFVVLPLLLSCIVVILCARLLAARKTAKV
jgi:hypothetical protein